MSANDQSSAALITQRDRFLKRVVESKVVYVVSGEEGLARVPSRRLKGREVTMLWSQRSEAERWAAVVAKSPQVKELSLGAIMMDVLPGLANIKRFVGTDWSSDGTEPEFDPTDLAERIRLEALDAFVHHARGSGYVWILEDDTGPALLVSRTRPDQFFLPCWANWEEAEFRINGPWRDMMSVKIPLADFLDRKLVWLKERGHLVSPGHTEGAGSIELSPEDLNQCFAGPPAA